MTAAATPAGKVPGTTVPAKGQLLLKAGRLLVCTAAAARDIDLHLPELPEALAGRRRLDV
ncbi:hypothetical protein [Arthrobacter sp. ISL-65]|uniref:hypothetical protein n=1 Tax=Arthrobacter sp. ISL-65 TaxID=2819112 RepID=UPI001BEA39DC|nr:hypothetical protein [Arthrobacter sp. ISL-65]MBT2550365.1 hypothetical protein [Arthrobacter sp. ISL-65]